MSRKNCIRKPIFDLQPLEIRRLLNSAFIDASHVLQVSGTGGSDNITINGVSSGTKVTVTGVTDAGGSLVQFTIGTGSNQFNQINMNAQAGNDTVVISNNFNYVSSTLFGSDGDDSITGGKGADCILGGNQNDRLDGQGGADIMDGQAGFNTANYSARTA